MLKPSELAELRRHLAALPADSTEGLDRDTALGLLAQLEGLQWRRTLGPHYAFCPHCGEGLDAIQAARTTRRPRRQRPPSGEPPPRHPNPVGAAATMAAAEHVTRVLAEAMTWRRVPDDRPPAVPEAFWVDFARLILAPILYLAHHRGRDMDSVRLQSHPGHAAETLVAVAAELEATGPSPDVELARRDWACIASQRSPAQREVFSWAYYIVRHWELSEAEARYQAWLEGRHQESSGSSCPVVRSQVRETAEMLERHP